MYSKPVSALILMSAVLLQVPAHAQVTASFPPPEARATIPASGDTWGVSLPNWLAAVSVAAKEGYESNLYGVSNNLAGHPDIANVASWFTTLSIGLRFNLLAGFDPGATGFLNTLSLAYSAEYTQYEAAAREDNLRNTFTLDASGSSGPWSVSIDNPLLFVDGSKEDQFFNYYNNLGYGAVRDRRNQVQERNTSSVRFDAPDWFVRAAGGATYFNLLIDEHNPVGIDKGYANWVNRDDVNGGLDLGYKVEPDFSFIAGWRIGQQTQAHPYYNLTANDNTYNRALFGFDGKPLNWLQAQLATGPDFRRYGDSAHLGITGDRHTWLYLQGLLTATVAPMDSLTASEKIWHFVSSAGLYSIQETSESITWKHRVNRVLSFSAGVSELGHRYDAPTVRNDWTTALPVDATFAVTQDLSLSADYSATAGHSHLPVSVTPGQSFEDNLVSVSIRASF
jgi:hypothetical protein